MTILSVVIPAYNEEDYLAETLSHVWTSLAAVEQATELIVVDNESTDATARIAVDAGATVIPETVHNIAKVRNTGAAHAAGDIIVFLDADTQVPEPLFAKIVEIMTDERCLGGAVRVEYGQFRRKWMKYYLAGWLFWDRFFNMKQGAAQFCRRTVFEELGGYDETIFVGEDIEFYWRLARHAHRNGGRVHYIRDPTVTTSPRRLDKLSIGRLLLITNPMIMYLNWRRRSFWKDWYEDTIR